MSRRDLDERNVRALYKTGDETTYAVSLPIEHIRAMNWQDGQQVVITADEENGRLIVQDWEA